MVSEAAYEQGTLFDMPEVASGYFKIKSLRDQQLPEGEEFSLNIGKVVKGSFVGEVLAFGWRDGKLTWEITATEVNLG